MLVLPVLGFVTFRNYSISMVGYISSSNLFPEPLSSDEEKEFLDKFEHGDESAKNVLIERNLRLVAHIAKKYTSSNASLDDLISIGTIGLIKGINSYNFKKGVKLSTYISRCIENEILMFFRNSKKLSQEVYLNEPIGKDKDDNVITLQEILENNERSIEDSIDLKIKQKKLYEKINTVLKPREKEILILRFGLNNSKPLTQNEVAKIFGISRSYVSRIETKAISKLSKEIREEQ